MTVDNHTKIALPTAGLIVIENNKLLLSYSRNKKAWYLPGGKIDAGETSVEAIQREIQEELNIKLDPSLLKLYCHITAPAYGENTNIIMEQDCYLYPLTEKIEPSHEIEEVKFFDYQAYLAEPIQVPGVLIAFEYLQNDNHIQYT